MMTVFGWLASVSSWFARVMSGEIDGRARDVANYKILFDQQQIQIEYLRKQIDGVPSTLNEFQKQKDALLETIYDLRAKLLADQYEQQIAILKCPVEACPMIHGSGKACK